VLQSQHRSGPGNDGLDRASQLRYPSAGLNAVRQVKGEGGSIIVAIHIVKGQYSI